MVVLFLVIIFFRPKRKGFSIISCLFNITHFALRTLRNLFFAAKVLLFFDICKSLGVKMLFISLFQYVKDHIIYHLVIYHLPFGRVYGVMYRAMKRLNVLRLQ